MPGMYKGLVCPPQLEDVSCHQQECIGYLLQGHCQAAGAEPFGNGNEQCDSEDTLMLDEFFQEHPTVKNGITFNSKAYIIGEYLLKKQKKDFNLMGYDLLQRNVDCLKQGSIFFLIAQQPTLQGFDGIKALCEYLILKKEITRENFMPIDLLTKENIEFYYNK